VSARTSAQLTDAQIAVVDHPLERPGVVDAGAGTGKTFTIVERVGALIERGACRADQILLLTFGRKAAAELRARIARRLGEAAPQCQTFHAFAWSILSSYLYDTGLSPETTVIEDADARVEFKAAFDAFLQDVTADDSGFPLRPFNRDEIRAELFALRQGLKEQGVSIDAFRARAFAAADRFALIGYRALLQPYKRPHKGQVSKELARVSDEELARQIREEKARVTAAADIFTRFDRRLAQRQVLTYADILLRAEAMIRSVAGVRDELRARYRCCIVDEYQDTDLAQHRFLEALFGSGLERIMVVGDVLQSIYSFRGAHPKNVQSFKGAPGARAYPLFENRRSLQQILDLAHYAVLPSHADAQPLMGRRGGAQEQVVHVSSLWVDEEAVHGATRADEREYIPFDRARVLEADAVARRIRELLDSGGMVETGAGTSEPVAPRHIAILSRTKTNVGPVTDALLAAGIPFRLVGGVGFYDAPEIRDALAWLRLLADPFDAHAVARALASAAIGASDAVVAELARRTEHDDASFARRALVDDLVAQDEIGAAARESSEKLRLLLDKLAPFAALPLLGALRAVCEHSGLEDHYRTSAHARAPQALANLAKLEALARGFAHDNPGAQPADFVTFIDELEHIDFDEREADIPSYDAVTISTIHSAKGLEWPIVFVLSVWPEVGRQSRLFLDADGALLYAEGADGSRPFHFLAVKNHADEHGDVPREDERADEEGEAEERRLFYVAITRARDRVFISGLRGKPSKHSAQGKAHKFLERVYEWLAQHEWVGDENIPATKPGPWQRPAPKAAARRAPPPLPAAPPDRALATPLSYSLIAAFEQCPRRATYRTMLRVPEVGTAQRRHRARRGWDALEPSDVSLDDSLLCSGDYGELLHKALELWAVSRLSGARVRSPGDLIAQAASVLAMSPAASQARTAARALERIEGEFADWTPLYVEAPFTLDVGSEGSPLLVAGYLDLLARDRAGRICLVDYKTGGVRGARVELQLALYAAAAKRVYGVDVERCFVGRIEDEKFSLEPIALVSDDELHSTIVRVRDGLLARDMQPNAGTWCGTCGYRAAPCMDFKNSKPTQKRT
jgi:ATP-dependent helicase/nuclease subunit A